MKVKIKLKEIDLTKGDEHSHPDIVVGYKLYLARVDGRYATGYFSAQWYGLNFSGFYEAGLQFDTPGSNSSQWEQLWEIVEVPRFKPNDRVRISFNVDLKGCFGVNTFMNYSTVYVVERYNSLTYDEVYLKNDDGGEDFPGKSYKEKYFYRVGDQDELDVELLLRKIGY